MYLNVRMIVILETRGEEADPHTFRSHGASFEVDADIGHSGEGDEPTITVNGQSDEMLVRHTLQPVLEVLKVVYPEKFIPEEDEPEDGN